MTREEQKASKAKEYYPDDFNCYYAFLDGAKWSDNNPANNWHDAKEKPRTKEWILLQISEDDYEAVSLSESGVNTWFNVWVDKYKVIRWAYIKDLLPKGAKK